MDADPGIDMRVFVVGVPRSGTTLLQSLLAAHSRVASFTESHFWSRHFRALPRLSSAVLTRDPAPRLREFLDRKRELDPDDLIEEPVNQQVEGGWIAAIQHHFLSAVLPPADKLFS